MRTEVTPLPVISPLLEHLQRGLALIVLVRHSRIMWPRGLINKRRFKKFISSGVFLNKLIILVYKYDWLVVFFVAKS